MIQSLSMTTVIRQTAPNEEEFTLSEEEWKKLPFLYDNHKGSYQHKGVCMGSKTFWFFDWMTMTVCSNPHNAYLDSRIQTIRKSKKYKTIIQGTSHNDFIEDFSSTLFTKLVNQIFTRTYVGKFACSDCKKVRAQERCHGYNEDRPKLLKRALERVYPDTSKTIRLRTIVIAFLEEHKTTQFTFKCKQCHLNESYFNESSEIEAEQAKE